MSSGRRLRHGLALNGRGGRKEESCFSSRPRVHFATYPTCHTRALARLGFSHGVRFTFAAFLTAVQPERAIVEAKRTIMCGTESFDRGCRQRDVMTMDYMTQADANARGPEGSIAAIGENRSPTSRSSGAFFASDPKLLRPPIT